VKVDVFVLGTGPFDRAAFARVTNEPLGEERERSFPLTTARHEHRQDLFTSVFGGESKPRNGTAPIMERRCDRQRRRTSRVEQARFSIEPANLDPSVETVPDMPTIM